MHARRALALALALVACERTHAPAPRRATATRDAESPAPRVPASRPRAAAAAVDVRTAPFELAQLEHPPFERIALWAPPASSNRALEGVLILHGNQGTPPDPAWMVDLRWQPAFDQRVLIVPALRDGDYEWARARTTRALGTLVERVAHEHPLDPARVYLLGYSAGASRVLAVAGALRGRFAGAVAVAGDVLRPMRASTAALAALRDLPVLLVCMTSDDGPQTRCALNDDNAAVLRRNGLRDVTVTRIPGTHAFDFERVGDVVARWIAARGR